MKIFLTSIVAAIVIAIGAVYALDAAVQQRADAAFAQSHSVRLPDHGNIHNLVGKSWLSSKDHPSAQHWTGDTTGQHDAGK